MRIFRAKWSCWNPGGLDGEAEARGRASSVCTQGQGLSDPTITRALRAVAGYREDHPNPTRLEIGSSPS